MSRSSRAEKAEPVPLAAVPSTAGGKKRGRKVQGEAGRGQTKPGPLLPELDEGSAGKRARGRTATGRPPLAIGGAVLAFEVAGQEYGLPVESVVQIVEMVAITPLPAAPELVIGVMNFHGRVIPVVDVRRRLHLPPQDYSLRTPIIISSMEGHIAGLVVDAVRGVVEVQPQQVQMPEQIFAPGTSPPSQLWAGVVRLSDGLLLILDLGAFLAPAEEKMLARPRGR
jgi:purine-binding chemotaxis protein CheW